MMLSSGLRREINDFVFRLCTCVGLLIGLMVAFDKVDSVKVRTCPKDEICVGQQMADALVPTLGAVLGGAMIGAIVGFVLVAMMCPRRRVAASTAAMDRKVIKDARYAGTCAGCGGTIRPGDPISWEGVTRRAYCAECS